MAGSLHNELLSEKNTLDQPCDVILVVKDGKQFKADRKVLSEASPFFEKLLNNDMKESKEGIVRLEMFSESVMAATLEFIYTGHVEILTEDNARELIVMADYLLLQKLKDLADDVLAQKLNISNCISTYYVSERYQCEELLSKTKKFILTNFTAVYAANREDVLNMSSKEVEMLISSDEIEVSAEEDVFKIILVWIDHDKDKRKKYFAELFRQVRLVYVSRDFLCSDVVTNDLVKENENCLDLVKDAMSIIDSRSYDSLPVPPRKSLESPALVICHGADFLCYFPDEDNWCRLCEKPSEIMENMFYPSYQFFPCEGKLYSVILRSSGEMFYSYSPYTNNWMQLSPMKKKYFWKIFTRNENEMWALTCDAGLPRDALRCLQFGEIEKDYSLFISKYLPESHSWEDVTTCDHFHPFVIGGGYCIVASGNFIYFISGWIMKVLERDSRNQPSRYRSKGVRDVHRYDISRGEWDKVADIQQARTDAVGSAVNGKVFIAGGKCYISSALWQDSYPLYSCEMYDETTNEWQFIAGASIRIPPTFHSSNLLVAADEKLYAVYRVTYSTHSEVVVDCYNPEKKVWEVKTERAFLKPINGRFSACATRIWKGLSTIRPLQKTSSSHETGTKECLTTMTQASTSHKAGKRKCFIM